MSSKVDRAIHGPSWTEVIVGAVLSLILGVALGALLLILKPVVAVKEVPKEPVPGTVYFVEGSKGGASAKQATEKLKTLAAGQSVKLTEDELNALAASVMPAPAPNDKSTESVATGTPNVRIRDGVMQVGVPVTLNVAGVADKVIVQARGGFQKEGAGFVFEPQEMFIGSCPVQRLPFLSGYVRSKVMESVPAELQRAWEKLSNVSLDGNTLSLTM